MICTFSDNKMALMGPMASLYTHTQSPQGLTSKIDYAPPPQESGAYRLKFAVRVEAPVPVLLELYMEWLATKLSFP